MANPEDSQRAWQIVQRTVGKDDPNISLANSIASNLEKAREEGYRSAFQQPVYETKKSGGGSGLFQFAIIMALIAGFALILMMAGSR